MLRDDTKKAKLAYLCSRAVAHPCRDVTRDDELLEGAEEKLEEDVELLGLLGSQQLVSIESLVAQVERTWANLGPSNINSQCLGQIHCSSERNK